MFCDFTIIPYSRPLALSDPYHEYDESDLLKIIATPDNNLSAKQFDMLFHGALAAGTYEESSYFLPYALAYVKECHNDSNHVLHCVLSWTMEMYVFLETDGIWSILDNHLCELFLFFTKNFILYGNTPLGPHHEEYATTFLHTMNGHKFQDWELNEMNKRKITPLYKPVDAYLARRFTSPNLYADWAWLIFCINGKTQSRGLPGAYRSEYMNNWMNDKSWHEKAEKKIIEYVIRHPEHELFWTEQLNNAMIF